MPNITLYQFPPVLGLPSMSPFCIKVQMALKLKGLDFEVVSTLLPRRYNPRGKVPYVMWDGQPIEDSTAIVKAIDERCKDGPALVPRERRQAADAHLLEDWADESLYWFGVYAKFGDPEGWALFRPPLAGAMPAMLRPLGPIVARRDLTHKLHAQGLLTRSRDLLLSEFDEHLAALSARLAQSAYLVGDTITMADIAVVAMLMPMMVGVTPEFTRRIEAHPAITAYAARVRRATHLDPAT